MEKEQPVVDVRIGAIKATVWENKSQAESSFSVTLHRRYKVETGEWKESCSFGRDDLLLLCKVLDQAHTWICRQHQVREEGVLGKL